MRIRKKNDVENLDFGAENLEIKLELLKENVNEIAMKGAKKPPQIFV